MTPYILHSAILIGLGYCFYQLFLKGITFFSINRWLLLAFLPLSFLLPFLEVSEEWSVWEEEVVDESIGHESDSPPYPSQSEFGAGSQGGTEPFVNLNKLQKNIKQDSIANENLEFALSENTAYQLDRGVNLPSERTTLINSKNNAENKYAAINWLKNFNWFLIIKYIYLFGILIFFTRFILNFFSLLFKIIKNPSIKEGAFKIIHLNQNIAPCSFANYIFINPNKYDQKTYDQILKHEKIHISKWHSLDIILTEILIAVQWFNPFAWLYRKVVENNLEYLTDQLMLTNGDDRQAYQMSLLKVSVPNFSLQLATNYNHSFLKKRIIMMNAKKSPVRSSWKYLLVLPIIGLSIICLNTVKSIANGQNVPIENQTDLIDVDDNEQNVNIELQEKKY